MPDVTGRVYEVFTEFILQRLGYRDEWTEGSGRQYLYEKHPLAPCHENVDICPYAAECHTLSADHQIPYGPWYDPDFFILEAGRPFACLHITHWSSPLDSNRKFWRTIEDHFEYKTLFGREFLSINLTFEALELGGQPRVVQDSEALISIKGWKPAVGSMLVTSFDASILFPDRYKPLERLAARVTRIAGSSRVRRAHYIEIMNGLYEQDVRIREQVDECVECVRNALTIGSHSRYSPNTIAGLQKVCYKGRLRSVYMRPTTTRYRKGIQQAYILREMIAQYWGQIVDPDESLWNVLQSNTRFLREEFGQLLGLPEAAQETDVNSFRLALASIPVRIDQGHPHYLLVNEAGLGHATWDEDFAYFILGLRALAPADLASFRHALLDLYSKYRTAYGMNDTLADLSDPNRIRAKVAYVATRYLNIANEQDFVSAVVSDAATPGCIAPYQNVVPDVHNWPLDILLTFYDLGSMQHITTVLPGKFERVYGHSLRPYAFLNDLGKLVSHLLQGVPVGPYFSKGVRMTEAEFYSAIWPLFAECLWEAIQEQGWQPLEPEEVIMLYRYTKAMRIISSPDLEPISYLFRRAMPNLTAGPTLRGSFNQLSVRRGWGREALTTDTAGRDPRSGAIIQTQAVVGAKNIDHKVKELAGRLRSVHLKCLSDDTFAPEPHPGHHYLVVDGDWPVTSKINLYEAGFEGIFEIGELDRLAQHLATLKEDPSNGHG